jgi:hypothetical protein
MQTTHKKITTKAFRTFLRLYPLFKSERISTNINLTLHKDLIGSVMTYASPTWEFEPDTSNETTVPTKQSSQHHW